MDLAIFGDVDIERIVESLRNKIDRLRLVGSCYEAGSEVRRLYSESLQSEEACWYPVSDDLAWLLQKAEEARQLSLGLVDITAGQLFVQSYLGVTPDASGAFGLGQFELDYTQRRVKLSANTLIDLHSLGKAFWADRCAEELQQEFKVDILVGLGGDIATRSRFYGTQFLVAVPLDGRSTYEVSDPLLYLAGNAIATSSLRSRSLRYHPLGLEATHIFDPRSMDPVRSELELVSVVGGSAGVCNILSLTTLIDGSVGMNIIDLLGYKARAVNHHGEVTYVGQWEELDKGIQRC